jgi:NAD-dependent DNA ligase
MVNKSDIKIIIDNPVKAFTTFSSDKIAELLLYFNNKYFEGKPEISDAQYDVIKELMEKHYPDHPVLQVVGAPVEHGKIKLPYWMGSMDKKKTVEQIDNFIKDRDKNDYVLSDKLDGVSSLLVVKKDKYSLYTRGDGIYGHDISHLIPFLGLNTIGEKCLSKLKSTTLVVRGELLITKNNFELVKHLGSNPRNMVSGLVNAKNPDLTILKVVDFVGYEMIEPRLKPSEQLENLKKCNFNVAEHAIKKSINFTDLGSYFVKRKIDCPYEIDGIIVTDNSVHQIIKSGNPKYSFAFKTMLEDNIGTVTVIDVQWNASKHGLLKPRIMYTPIELGGVTMQYTTGYNAKYIVDNVIGPGAVISITRSGDVIPKIVEVITKAENNKPQMPNVKYVWTSTEVDIKLLETNENASNENKQFTKDTDIKVIAHFFSKIETVGVSSGIITKLFDSGFDTVVKVLNMTKEDFLTIPGIKDKMAEKLFASIALSVKNASPVTIMSGSNKFGMGLGEKKLKLIYDKYPDIAYNTKYLKNKNDLIEKINAIEGFQTKLSTQFSNNLEEYYDFLNELPLAIKNKLMVNVDANIEEQQSDKEDTKSKKIHRFENMSIVFTGIRDKNIEKIIEEEGGKISNIVNSKTSILVIKEKDSGTVKEESAKKLNLPIYTMDEFKKKFELI